MRGQIHTTKWIKINIIKGWISNYILNTNGTVSANNNYKYSEPYYVEAWECLAVLFLDSWDRSWSKPICVNVYSTDTPSADALLDNVFYENNGKDYDEWKNEITITVPHDWYICFGIRETSDRLSCVKK